MKKQLSIFGLLILFVLQACEGGDISKSRDDLHYPAIIDALHLQQWYDSTKWYMYTYYCMDTPSIYIGNGATQNIIDKPYSDLELYFDSLVVRNDSFSFYFSFYNEVDQKLINYFNYADWTGAINGLMFSERNADTTLYFVTSNSSMPLAWISFPRSAKDTTTFRRIKTLQPDVVQFIREHKATLTPWFYAEAKKRGLITHK